MLPLLSSFFIDREHTWCYHGAGKHMVWNTSHYEQYRLTLVLAVIMLRLSWCDAFLCSPNGHLFEMERDVVSS